MLIVPAHAKLNLTLAVRRRREDGWHDIDSVVVPIDWHDLVAVRVVATPGIRLTMSGATAGIPEAHGNLAYRAAEAVAELLGGRVGVSVWLHKRIPTLAGLGGGSADAAAVLMAGASLRPPGDQPIPAAAIAEVAGGLGSDVPALIAGGAVRVRGVGIEIEPISLPPLFVVVAIAGAGSTPAAYAALRPDEIGGDDRPDRFKAVLEQGGFDASLCGSGLEAAACRINADLDGSLARLRQSTGVVWHLTGSGGAVYAIVADATAAAALADQVRQLGIVARACRTIASSATPPPSRIRRRGRG